MVRDELASVVNVIGEKWKIVTYGSLSVANATLFAPDTEKLLIGHLIYTLYENSFYQWVKYGGLKNPYWRKVDDEYVKQHKLTEYLE